ncbi:MAG: NTP transferase domain-containing protein [Acidiferrobacterales bacterium]
MSRKTDTAVVLAAGMGTRLNERGTWHPKGFIQLGELPIIEESVLLLAEAGIKRIIIVTGHLAEFYERFKQSYPQLIETVYNPKYAECGHMYSLYCAREHVQNDFLLMESDLIYERRALAACIDFPQDNVVLMSGPTGAGDEVYIEARDGLLVGMTKNRDELQSEAAGELVGISKISGELFQVLLEEAEAQFRTTLNVAYDSDCLTAAARRYPIHCHLIEDLAWSEIDYEMHMAYAQNQVYPKLLEVDGPRPRRTSSPVKEAQGGAK